MRYEVNRNEMNEIDISKLEITFDKSPRAFIVEYSGKKELKVVLAFNTDIRKCRCSFALWSV